MEQQGIEIINKLKMLIGDEADNEKTESVYLSRRYFAKLRRSGILQASVRVHRKSSNYVYCNEHYNSLSYIQRRMLNFTNVRNSARVLLKIIEKLSCGTYSMPTCRFDLFYYNKVSCRFRYTQVYFHELITQYPWDSSNSMILLEVKHFLLLIAYDVQSQKYIATDMVFFHTAFAQASDFSRLNSREKFYNGIRL